MTTHHVCISVRGYVLGSDHDLISLFQLQGRRLSPREARELLLEQLAQGREVLPIGPACEGFDYSGGGCPGHPTEVDRG